MHQAGFGHERLVEERGTTGSSILVKRSLAHTIEQAVHDPKPLLWIAINLLSLVLTEDLIG